MLYGSQAEFAQTNVVSGLLLDSVGGVTDSARRRITMPFAPTMAETNRVLGHEIVHAFQFDIAKKIGADTGQPLWFIEGMAEYLSRGSLNSESSLWLRDAVLNDRLPKSQSQAARELSPYLYGHAFWSYLGHSFGDHIVEKALKPGRRQRRLTDRIRHATGVELDELFNAWRNHAMEMYGTRVDRGEPLKPWTRDSMQLGPALSPDGTQAVFFSERDRLSIDLFLADVPTGRVIRKLATTAASAKFDSLQPLRSSGAWSADGQWFAFAAVRRGGAALMLMDMTGRGRDRELVFERLGQVMSPTWSPDGTKIALSALAGGTTDLYVADAVTGNLWQITDDVFADLQPAWSHDGRTIAFATERFLSDLATAVFGRPRLALLDVNSGAIAELPVAGTTAFSPQWSADDRELYFVGDPNGSMNVFRARVDGSAMHQITNVDTGISGITSTSPALSLSGNGTTLAFTVYERGRPRMMVQTEKQATSGATALDETPASPVETARGTIDSYLADALTGLPGAASVKTQTYLPRMSLEGVGQPYLSSGGGPFGTFIRGGGALFFGDMLGERRLGAAVQIGNHLRDAAFTVRYINQERRWNFGVIGELQPTVVRYSRWETIDYEGRPAFLKQADYFERMQVRTAAVVAYPFSRGLGVEFTGGVRHSWYSRDLRSQTTTIDTGKVLARDQVKSSGGAPTTVGEVSAALVHDTTVFGPNGPLLGTRYRFEFTPAAGQLSYTGVQADVRHYMMPVRPYTIATRVMHSARYGADGSDPRLLSNFLGSSYFVRGHRDDFRYCRPEQGRICGDDLLGHQLSVANLELRVPIRGMRSRQIKYGAFPADAFVFADAGMVQSAHRRTTISSFGGGVRLNAFGFPLEFAAIRALDGARPRWQFDLGFRTGF